MKNREKLFILLNKMNNYELSNSIDISCQNCPAKSFCFSLVSNDLSCQDIIYNWLEFEEK